MLLKEEKNDVNVQNIEKRQYAVDRLLEMHGINVNLQNKYGATALMMAVNRGHSEFVKMLLGKKGNRLIYSKQTGVQCNYVGDRPRTTNSIICNICNSSNVYFC